MPTPTGGLITLDDLKADLGLTGTTHDKTLERIILSVTKGIENFCGGRTFIAQTETSKTLDGDGTATLLLPYPIISITSIDNNGTTVTSSDYVLYSNEGRVVLTDGTAWSNADLQVVTITFRHGYEYDDIPYPLQEAAMIWATKRWLAVSNKERVAATSISTGDQTISYERSIPQEAMELIKPYDPGIAAARWAL